MRLRSISTVVRRYHGPSEGQAPNVDTHVQPWLLSPKYTHWFSYELLEGKDTLMLIAYIIPSTSIQLGRSHKSSVWRSRADQRSGAVGLALGQAQQSCRNNGNNICDTKRHRTKDPRADPHIPRISRNAFEPLHNNTFRVSAPSEDPNIDVQTKIKFKHL